MLVGELVGELGGSFWALLKYHGISVYTSDHLVRSKELIGYGLMCYVNVAV
jgi:hypothetical protein